MAKNGQVYQLGEWIQIFLDKGIPYILEKEAF